MLIIQGILVSDEIVEEAFVCNLDACKGACCWEGDYGAPLEESELAILKEISPKIESFLSEAGKSVIAESGPVVYYEEAGFWGTALVEGGACAFLTFDEKGIAHCGIEQAWQAGVIDFRKPISCHLYPVRVKKNPHADFEALNYDRWDICSAACVLGKQLKVPVYRFVREALIRKYGAAFYEELDQSAEYLKNREKQAPPQP